MEYDLVVIGAGFWGVAITLFAEAQGKSVLLVDSMDTLSGSRAASGYFAFSWFKKTKQSRERAKLAMFDAIRLGVEVQATGCITHTYDGKTKNVDDFYMFHPVQFLDLRRPDLIGEANIRSFTDDYPVRVSVSDGHDGWIIKAARVVVAAGANTDKVLKGVGYRLGVTGLPGTGVIFKSKIDTPLTYQTSPYFQYIMRDWRNGMARLGETLEVTQAGTDYYVNKMMNKVFGGFQDVPAEVARVHGVRPMLKEQTVKVVVPGVIAATGGGRMGGIMSFWAAREAYELAFEGGAKPSDTE